MTCAVYAVLWERGGVVSHRLVHPVVHAVVRQLLGLRNSGRAHLPLHQVAKEPTEIGVVRTVIESQRSTVLQIDLELVGVASTQLTDRQL